MIQYFEKQLKRKESKPVTEELLPQLGGKSIYGDYQVGDVILHFLEATKYTPTNITMSVTSVVKRDLDKLEKEFEFVEMKESFPVLYRREG